MLLHSPSPCRGTNSKLGQAKLGWAYSLFLSEVKTRAIGLQGNKKDRLHGRDGRFYDRFVGTANRGRVGDSLPQGKSNRDRHPNRNRFVVGEGWLEHPLPHGLYRGIVENRD